MAEKKEMSFEEKLDRLNAIVDKVENETLPIEESLKLYQEGNALIKELEATLKEAEKKIGALQNTPKD
jgi:exodeoxyribonuclease VII small subunit